MTLRPVEWEIRHPLSGDVLAIVRMVALGPRSDWFARAVSPEPDRARRRLIGYWSTPQEAHDGALALYERSTGRSLSGGDARSPSMPIVPMKPPPGDDRERGMAARPRRHSARA